MTYKIANNVITNSSIKVMLQCQMKRLRELDLGIHKVYCSW
jgi:hypothetical protein